VLPMASSGGCSSAGATRHSLRRVVIDAASRVDGVSHAAATVTASRVKATVSTPLHDSSGLADQVRTAVGEQLTAIALDRPPRINVRVNTTRST